MSSNASAPKPWVTRSSSAKNFIALSLPQSFETAEQVAARLAELIAYDLPLDDYDHFVERITAVTAEDVRRVAREFIHPDHMTVVIVGDRASIEPALRNLPFGPVEIKAVEEFVR